MTESEWQTQNSKPGLSNPKATLLATKLRRSMWTTQHGTWPTAGWETLFLSFFSTRPLIIAATSTDLWPINLKSWKLPRPRPSRPLATGRQGQWSGINRWWLVCASKRGSGNFHQHLSLPIILGEIWPDALSPFDSNVAAWRHKNNKQEGSGRVTATTYVRDSGEWTAQGRLDTCWSLLTPFLSPACPSPAPGPAESVGGRRCAHVGLHAGQAPP